MTQKTLLKQFQHMEELKNLINIFINIKVKINNN